MLRPLALLGLFVLVTDAQTPAREHRESRADVRLLDLTGDGLLDMLSLRADGALAVSVNEGGRSFVAIRQELPRIVVENVLASDLDGDTHLDLYLVSREANAALLGDGSGGFREATRELGLAHAGAGLSAERLDVDADGLLDLVLHSEEGDVLFWAESGGSFRRSEETPGLVPSPMVMPFAGPSFEDGRAVLAARRPARDALPGDDAGSDVAGNPSSPSSLDIAERRTRPSPARPVDREVLEPGGSSGETTALMAFPIACADSVRDQASPGSCLQATSVPTTGLLFPGPHLGGVNNLQSGTNSFIGGGRDNQSTAGHSTIGGGQGNFATSIHATIGGGAGNTASGTYATVGGGRLNLAKRSFSTVGGGILNEAGLTGGQGSTVGGGGYNSANGTWAMIGGGKANSAPGSYATVGGGEQNLALGLRSTVAGGSSNRADTNLTTVGGGQGNKTGFYSSGATIAGGKDNLAYSYAPYGAGSYGTYAAIGGGSVNTATAAHATVAGGQSNDATAAHATVGGGRGNGASGVYSAIGGGYLNTATAMRTTVAGGQSNDATAAYATVGGGEDNVASGAHATVGGGYDHLASGYASTIGGGGFNDATGIRSTVAGGVANSAYGNVSAVGGGAANRTDTYGVVGGGSNNRSGAFATIGGGVLNRAYGVHSTIPGGNANTASGASSFAAGTLSTATHPGSFVWGDSLVSSIKTSSVADEVNIYASGGTRIFSNSTATTGVLLAPGGGSWSSVSDRASKENLAPVDARAVLERVAALPITTWNYRAQGDSIRHMGPMAQDFHAAFGLGISDKLIDTIDPDGVALAAIQGLHALVDDRQAEIAALRSEHASQIASLILRFQALEARLAEPPVERREALSVRKRSSGHRTERAGPQGSTSASRLGREACRM